MADYNDYDGRKSVVLEGMYRGVEGKIDEVKASVTKELQFNSEQQASAYESLTAELKAGLENVLREIGYLSQQSSAIYDFNRNEQSAMQQAILEATQETAKALERKFNERLAAFRREILEVISGGTIPVSAEPVPAEESVPAEEEPISAEPQEAPTEAVRTLPEDEAFDYTLLAEKIATILPETDYDLIADKVAAALPQTDADVIAEKVAAALPFGDETAIADRVAEVMPMVDYDLVAERVATTLEHDYDLALDETGVAAIAEKLAETVADRVAERVASMVTEAVDCDKIAEKIAEKLAEKYAAPAPEKKQKEAAIGAPAPAPKAEEGDLTTRYKRSFTAKIIESEDAVKESYFALKNAFLSYGRVNSQVNWSNDRFSFRGDTIAKVSVRGKTLVVYLALDPKEFPESTYHQKDAGDTKMYEKTPFMMKVRSGVALKRALRLVEILMERVGADFMSEAEVDYAPQFSYRSEEQLLAEGLIKTALVERSDLDF